MYSVIMIENNMNCWEFNTKEEANNYCRAFKDWTVMIKESITSIEKSFDSYWVAMRNLYNEHVERQQSLSEEYLLWLKHIMNCYISEVYDKYK